MSAQWARSLALLAWALFFALVWVTDETPRYLGPRTEWVVPFGALALGGAALLSLEASLRRRGRGERLRVRDAAGLAALLVPIPAVAVVPRAELGALAASRKDTNRGVSPQRPSGGEVSFAEIDYARYSPSFAEEVGIRPGRAVELVGFVADPTGETPRGMFELGRFYVSCCAADALPTLIAIDPRRLGRAGAFERDTWLRVRGRLARVGAEFVVRAEQIDAAEAPQNPYLYLR